MEIRINSLKVEVRRDRERPFHINALEFLRHKLGIDLQKSLKQHKHKQSIAQC